LWYGLNSVAVKVAHDPGQPALTPLFRWRRLFDLRPSSPGGCTSIYLMYLAQLGLCSTRANCCHAFSSGSSTVNSRRNSVIIGVLPGCRTDIQPPKSVKTLPRFCSRVRNSRFRCVISRNRAKSQLPLRRPCLKQPPPATRCSGEQRFLDQVENACRLNHLSDHTEQSLSRLVHVGASVRQHRRAARRPMEFDASIDFRIERRF
jgi:hypothetical protein